MLHHKTTKDAQTSLDRCNKIYYISFITAWKIGEKLKTAFEIEFSKCLHLISGNTIPKATFDKFEKRLVQIAKAPGEAVWTFQYGIPFHLPKFGPTLWLFRALGRNFSYIQLLQLSTLLAIIKLTLDHYNNFPQLLIESIQSHYDHLKIVTIICSKCNKMENVLQFLTFNCGISSSWHDLSTHNFRY